MLCVSSKWDFSHLTSGVYECECLRVSQVSELPLWSVEIQSVQAVENKVICLLLLYISKFDQVNHSSLHSLYWQNFHWLSLTQPLSSIGRNQYIVGCICMTYIRYLLSGDINHVFKRAVSVHELCLKFRWLFIDSYTVHA